MFIISSSLCRFVVDVAIDAWVEDEYKKAIGLRASLDFARDTYPCLSGRQACPALLTAKAITIIIVMIFFIIVPINGKTPVIFARGLI